MLFEVVSRRGRRSYKIWHGLWEARPRGDRVLSIQFASYYLSFGFQRLRILRSSAGNDSGVIFAAGEKNRNKEEQKPINSPK